MDTNVKTKKSSSFSLFRAFYKNLWLLILLTIVGLTAGIVVGKVRVKPTYTARCTVILATSLDPSSQNSNSASTDVSHTKIYLPTIRKTVSAPITIEKANSLYDGDGNVSAGGISVSSSDSCIFTISYSDADERSAILKLESVISATDLILNEQPVLSAGEANLIPLQSECSVSVSESISKYVFFGILLGLGSAVIIVLARFLFDNKI